MNLISLTITTEISKMKKDGNFRQIKFSNLEITEQSSGSVISEITQNNPIRSKIKVSEIKSIQLEFSDFDIPLSWAQENKGTDSKIKFVISNIKYNEETGMTLKNKISLSEDDFEAEELRFTEEKKTKILDPLIKIKDPDNIFYNFANLIKEFLKKAITGEGLSSFESSLKEYQSAPSGSQKDRFYKTKNFFTGDDEVKERIVEILKILENMRSWRPPGIEKMLEFFTAEANGFEIKNPSSVAGVSAGKYRGFPISVLKKDNYNKPRFTRENIDSFRAFFTNHSDQTEPHYFLGFEPGDLEEEGGKKVYFTSREIAEGNPLPHAWKIKLGSKKTKIIFELNDYNRYNANLAETKELLTQDKFSAFDEIVDKNKQEHLKLYRSEIESLDFWTSASPDQQQILKNFYQILTKLFSVLDNLSYASESEETCQTALGILNLYQNPADGSDELLIKKRFATEIDQKRQEIQNRLDQLRGGDLSVLIAAAANENYGSGQLTAERKKIFLQHQTEIKTSAILNETKSLIKLLIQAEGTTDANSATNLLNQLKSPYQNATGDKKTAYTIVNKVDNSWADRLIAQLESYANSDLTHQRTELKDKYGNSPLAQAIFDNPLLDSISALAETDKLLTKVQEALEKIETDSSLLTELESYSAASPGDIKNQAYQAVNGFQNQVQAALSHLRDLSKNRAKAMVGIQTAKNEAELTAAYQTIQNSTFYQSEKNKQLVDKIHARKKTCLHIAQDTEVPAILNQFLQTELVKIIPDSIQTAEDEAELTQLENSLKEFSTASAGEEKRKVYQKYQSIIDEVLTEIAEEKQRWNELNQPTPHQQPNSPTGGLPNWAIGLIVVGITTVVGLIAYYFYQSQFKKSKLEE